MQKVRNVSTMGSHDTRYFRIWILESVAQSDLAVQQGSIAKLALGMTQRLPELLQRYFLYHPAEGLYLLS